MTDSCSSCHEYLLALRGLPSLAQRAPQDSVLQPVENVLDSLACLREALRQMSETLVGTSVAFAVLRFVIGTHDKYINEISKEPPTLFALARRAEKWPGFINAISNAMVCPKIGVKKDTEIIDNIFSLICQTDNNQGQNLEPFIYTFKIAVQPIIEALERWIKTGASAPPIITNFLTKEFFYPNKAPRFMQNYVKRLFEAAKSVRILHQTGAIAYINSQDDEIPEKMADELSRRLISQSMNRSYYNPPFEISVKIIMDDIVNKYCEKINKAMKKALLVKNQSEQYIKAFRTLFLLEDGQTANLLTQPLFEHMKASKNPNYDWKKDKKVISIFAEWLNAISKLYSIDFASKISIILPSNVDIGAIEITMDFSGQIREIISESTLQMYKEIFVSVLKLRFASSCLTESAELRQMVRKSQSIKKIWVLHFKTLRYLRAIESYWYSIVFEEQKALYKQRHEKAEKYEEIGENHKQFVAEIYEKGFFKAIPIINSIHEIAEIGQKLAKERLEFTVYKLEKLNQELESQASFLIRALETIYSSGKATHLASILAILDPEILNKASI